MVLLWIAWITIKLATGRFEDKNELTPTAFVAVAQLFMFVPASIGVGRGVMVGRRMADSGGARRSQEV